MYIVSVEFKGSNNNKIVEAKTSCYSEASDYAELMASNKCVKRITIYKKQYVKTVKCDIN